MLNQIRSHLSSCSKEQRLLEEIFAKQISALRYANVEAFKRNIPSLVPLIENTDNGNFTIFCNKFGEANIVDISSGQVVYGYHPQSETEEQTIEQLSEARAIQVCTKNGTTAAIVLGLGLGYQLPKLLNSGMFSNVVVYEPFLDFFKCSLSTLDWKSLFTQSKKNNVGLFLQIGKDASQLYENIQELSANVDTSKVVLINHINHPTFNEIVSQLKDGKWDELKGWYPNTKDRSFVDYLPLKTPYSFQDNWKSIGNEFPLFQSNIKALKQYFPRIYSEFSTYEPKAWVPVQNASGIVNAMHYKTGAMFHGRDPEAESIESYNNFSLHPQKDGLILGYKGKKLRHYLHYQFVVNCEPVLESLSAERGELPDEIKSMILFGIGCGYSLKAAFEKSRIRKLFICEPNKDLFYTSLFCISWEDILSNFSDEGSRLYLNIGDDGTNLANDLMVQFQSIGPYVLASTYFYQGYYNPKLNDAIINLREQLRVLIAMGDYFDNAKYGTAHTHTAILDSVGFLKKNAAEEVCLNSKEFPVFIVGNGPSLDDCIELIRQERDNVIVVSCGTALQSLYRNGIKPDFHAEIEINRATYDWAMRIGDLKYLSEISLISCNGVHPDTYSLYKDVFLAFKQGESSTVSTFEVYDGDDFALLDFSYPTVSNFVLDFFTTLGMTQLYLVGVDLGFVDDKHHHSLSSGYYDSKGKELYSYSESNNTSFIVPGNFRKWVNTKLEFKMSKTILENVLKVRKTDVYNLSDGARIVGTRPLNKENVLISKSDIDRGEVILNIKENAFTVIDKVNFERRYSQRFDQKVFVRELSELLEALNQQSLSRERVESIIQYQRDKLVASYLSKKSALFYYMNGTINFTNSVLSKILNVSDDETVVSAAQEVIDEWRLVVKKILITMQSDPLEPDGSSTFGGQRRLTALKDFALKTGIAIKIKNREIFRPEFTFLSAFSNQDSLNSASFNIEFVDNILPKNKDKSTCYIIDRKLNCLDELLEGGLIVYAPSTSVELISQKHYEDHIRVNCALFTLGSPLKNALVIPKLNYVDKNELHIPSEIQNVTDKYNVYETPFLFIISKTVISHSQRLLNSGDRLTYVPIFTSNNFAGKQITEEVFGKLHLGK